MSACHVTLNEYQGAESGHYYLIPELTEASGRAHARLNLSLGISVCYSWFPHLIHSLPRLRSEPEYTPSHCARSSSYESSYSVPRRTYSSPVTQQQPSLTQSNLRCHSLLPRSTSYHAGMLSGDKFIGSIVNMYRILKLPTLTQSGVMSNELLRGKSNASSHIVIWCSIHSCTRSLGDPINDVTGLFQRPRRSSRNAE